MDKHSSKLFSQSGGWEVQDHGASVFGEVAVEGSLPGSRTVPSLCVEGTRDLPGASFIKGLIPFVTVPSSRPKHLLMAHLLILLSLEFGILIYGFD